MASIEFLAEDNISSLEQLEEKLSKEENLSKEILHVRRENKLTIYSFKENEVGRPIIKYSLIITEDLQFSMWCNEVKVPLATAKGLHQDKKVTTLSGVLNILNQLHNVLNMKQTFTAFFNTHRTTLLITTFLCQIGIFTTAINGTPNQSKGIII